MLLFDSRERAWKREEELAQLVAEETGMDIEILREELLEGHVMHDPEGTYKFLLEDEDDWWKKPVQSKGENG